MRPSEMTDGIFYMYISQAAMPRDTITNLYETAFRPYILRILLYWKPPYAESWM